jgi:hypothetical protein
MTITINGTTGIAGVDGSASTPAVQGSDTNTGIFFPAADTIAFGEGGAEAMRIDSSGNVGIAVVPEAWTLFKVIQFNEQGAVGGTSASSQLFLNTYYDGAYKFIGTGYAQRYYQATGAHVWETSNASGSADGAITFVERARIDSSGNLLVGTTSNSLYNQNTVNGIGIIPGTSSAIQIATDPAGSTGNACILLNMRNTPINGAKYIRFFYNGASDIGNISLNGTTAVAYNTSSDYRLKNRITPMTGALDKVALLKPVTYKWNADNSDGQGFIAHELQEVVPDCVSGEKDAVDAEGNPQYQGVDTSFLVATLTAAIQELKAELDTVKAQNAAFEARLAALEAK